jgi:hypothetical protein
MLSTILNLINLVFLIVTIVGAVLIYKKYKEYKQKYEDEKKETIRNYVKNNLQGCAKTDEVINCVISKTDLNLNINSFINNIGGQGNTELENNLKTCKTQFSC